MLKTKHLCMAGFTLVAAATIAGGLVAPAFADDTPVATPADCKTATIELGAACAETYTQNVSLTSFSNPSDGAKNFYINTTEGDKLDLAQTPVGGWIDIKTTADNATIGDEAAGHLSVKIDLAGSNLTAETITGANTSIAYIINGAERSPFGVNANRFYYDSTEKALYYFWGQYLGNTEVAVTQTMQSILDGDTTLQLKVTIAGTAAKAILNLTALNAAKAEAAALVEAAYTEASWTALTTALAMAETTQAAVDSKTAAIISAIAALEETTPAIGTGEGAPVVTINEESVEVIGWNMSDFTADVANEGEIDATTNFLTDLAASNESFRSFLEQLAADADALFLSLETFDGCEGAECAVDVPVSGLVPSGTYSLYHFDHDGNVTLVDDNLTADEDGALTLVLTHFSGYVLTSAQITLDNSDSDVSLPATGAMTSEQSGAILDFGIAALATTLVATAVGAVILKKRATQKN